MLIVPFFGANVGKASTAALRWSAAIVALCACVPPPNLAAAVAAGASCAIETTPFLAFAWLAERLPARRLRRPAAFVLACAGCGCGSLPGALSLASVAIVWMTFGPAAAAVRWAVAAWIALAAKRSEHAHERGNHPFADLPGIAIWAGTASVASAFLAESPIAHVFRLYAFPYAALAALAGAALGAIAPCTLGAVAAAATLHATLPAISWGMLAGAGILRIRLPESAAARGEIPIWATVAALAAAAAVVVFRHGGGLVNPRLLPLVAAGAAAAAVAVCVDPTGATTRRTFACALAMLAASLAGFAGPTSVVESDTTYADMYVGELFAFSGAPTIDRHALVRYAIECCRADAQPVVVRLDRPLPRSGRWFEARGRIARDARGYFLAVRECDVRVLPADPFFYR